ncbi:MAG TPA: preprotein translocase subunit SecE [Actinomycetota bacterium]|nr:preprotein translocase subunit SecE [Actinomycetota bacterium]
MNRQYKRLMKKEQERKATAPRPTAAAAANRPRTKPREFVKEVIGELRKVAWPTRKEVVAYSTVVFVSVVVIAALIFGMDYVFAKGVLFLYDIEG